MLIMMLTMIIIKLSCRGLPFLQRKHDGRHMQSYAMMPENAQLAGKPGRMEDPTLAAWKNLRWPSHKILLGLLVPI